MLQSRRGKTDRSDSGLVNQVAGQNGSFLNGSIGLRINQVMVQVGLTCIFKQAFFFQLQKQINDNLFRENE